MEVVLIGMLFVVASTIGYIALRNAHDYSDANEIVPGVPTKAPKEWAGAHSPEARLHRRIRDAVTSLRANSSLDAVDLAPVREGLQREALAIDDKLIAVAALAGKHKSEPLAEIERAVDALEAAIAEVVMLRGPSTEATAEAIEQARTRARLVEEARLELGALGTGSDLDELRRQLDGSAAGVDATPDDDDEGPPSVSEANG